MSRAAIEAGQARRLRALLGKILPRNPFWARRLGRAARGGTLRELLARLPLTTKQELAADQAAHPPFGTNLTWPPARYRRLSQTSATTGAPLRWLDTEEDWEWMVGNWVEVLRAAGVRAGDRVLFAFSFGPFLGFWLAFSAAERLGCLCLPAGGMSSAARLGMILQTGATVLCCTPTYALRLAEAARQERIRLTRSRVRAIVVAGEPGGSIPAVRARISRAWRGARVFDHHGMTEVGAVTYECPGRPGSLLVMEHAYVAEILDRATGREVAEGEVGELVLTTLGRAGSPLVRYRTGDLVRKGFVGGRLVLEGGILGRCDDMVIVRGVNVYPSAVEAVVRRFREVAEYQVVVGRRGAQAELAVRVEPAAGCRDAAALAGRVASALRAALALRIPVRAAAPGALPRAEMKARRWINRV